MHPTLFHLGGITIYSFGLFLAFGIIAGCLLVAYLAKRYHLGMPGLFDNLLFMIFTGVIGARIAYIIAYPQYFKAPLGSFMTAFALWQGGLVFYGALLGGLVGVWFILRYEHKNLLRWLDILMFGLLVGISLGQIGCTLGGCAQGLESSSRFAIDSHLPIALYEAILAAALLVAGLWLYRQKPLWRRDGRIFFGSALLYFGGRLFFDYFRITTLHIKGVSVAVIVDVIFLLIVTLALVLYTNKKRRDAIGSEEGY